MLSDVFEVENGGVALVLSEADGRLDLGLYEGQHESINITLSQDQRTKLREWLNRHP